ncbi:glucokinase regulator family [Talaromyces proteolyticus]|uniref:Glucokinase regulator family n=1 Tax=Talaromyces proteolyticus TaxID=1131652 RepID=A0AAD4KJX3_9EURO|nr:glucokinase regulator family [Talaromyces proteolyticus]KAH8690932.1 glucokinase regulator family [Talaromyces proteolyticus]
MTSLASLQTEQKNVKTSNIDAVSSLEICQMINEEDDTVAKAVKTCLPQIAAAIDVIVPRLLAGGRVIYTGAGTSGRLGVLDASEIPPTFSAPPWQFVGLIAGGDEAIRNAVEGAEDLEDMGAADLAGLSPPANEKDVVVGIASSGRTPYVLGSLKYAQTLRAATVGLSCVRPSALEKFCDILIECVTGPEVITGSTRLKAGTATKMILNMISTGSQVRIGKTFGNFMVDLKTTNDKLRDRARRVVHDIVRSTSALDINQEKLLDQVLAQCDGEVKLSILVATLSCSPEEGKAKLLASSGSLKRAISKPNAMTTLNVLGLNCGTSIDVLQSKLSQSTECEKSMLTMLLGIDVALCRISSLASSNDVQIELISYTEVSVDPDIRNHVLRLCRPNQKAATTSLAEICDLNFALGKEFFRAIEESKVDLAEVDLIASHGQTLWHQPLGEDRSTLQMAEPSIIAHKSKRTVVSNFRVAELAAGRQGAPLAGFFEAGLLLDQKVTRISQNIGGMGNATVLPASSNSKSDELSPVYLAFDTGPGNVLIDAAMRILTDGKQHYDRDGILGAKGESEIDEDLVDSFLKSEPYFQRQPPKTTGRELFSDDISCALVKRMQASGKSPEAIIATITRITAESIARAYEQFVIPFLGEGHDIDEIYICGGGAYNPNILKHLQARFPESRVLKLNDAPTKLDPSAKEAVMFALLGYLCICGRSVPIAADAESLDPAILGVVTPGENYREILQKVVRAQDFGNIGKLGRILMLESKG